MEKTKNIALVGAVVGVFVLGGFAFNSPSVVVPRAEDVAKLVSNRLGALTGPDIPYPFLKIGGVTKRYFNTAFNTSSSTFCSFGPIVATSTVNFSAKITTGTSTALYVMLETVGKATTTDDGRGYAPALATATSTLRGEPLLLAANALGEFVFRATTSSVLPLDRNGVVKPSANTDQNFYLVFHAKNAGGGTLAQAGTNQVLLGNCTAELTEL